MNSLHNANNPYQGTEKRVLCLCSAGLLRSPTAAFVLQKELGYNTRAAGVTDYALIPVTEVLLKWADEIVCVNQETYNILIDDIKRDVPEVDADIVVLDIPDIYPRMDSTLQNEILRQYLEKDNV
jgi:predicted protein tyrosine phosphatase